MLGGFRGCKGRIVVTLVQDADVAQLAPVKKRIIHTGHLQYSRPVLLQYFVTFLKEHTHVGLH